MKPVIALAIATIMSSAAPRAAHAGPVVFPADGIHAELVMPSEADPTIGGCGIAGECPDRGHRVYWSTMLLEDHPLILPRLLVILPAHCSEQIAFCDHAYDFDYDALARFAVGRGFHVVVLDWPDGNPPGIRCLTASSSACYANLRTEIAFGTDTTTLSTIAEHPQDAIVSRLRSLLHYLDATEPDRGWDRWLDADGSIHWADVALAGHSGYAAFIASRRKVARVAMFAEPADSFGGAPAPWLSASQTPASVYQGLIEHDDDITTNIRAHVVAGWDALHLTSSQRIIATDACDPDQGCHRMIVEDSARFANAWAQLLGYGN